jgi:hypothetical protein
MKILYKILLAIVIVVFFRGVPQSAQAASSAIKLMPSLSSHSLKNGESFKISVLFTSEKPVVKVVARISDIDEAITLRLVSGNALAGLYETVWAGHDLREQEYTVHITVTDSAGNSTTDSSLRFTDPLFGNTTVGSSSYPNATLKRVGALTFNTGEDNAFTGVVDTVNGFAYFGTNTSPGQVIKVRLSDFTRVGSLSAAAGEDFFVGSAIDVANGFAYFSTNESTSNIVKIQLSDFTRIGAVNVGGGGFVQGLTIDATNGFLYAATNTTPSNVYKINLGTFTNTANIALAAGENNVVRIVLDTANDTGYFPTQTSPSKIVKVTLSTLTRVGALTLAAGENSVRAATIDTTNGFAYFGTNTSPGQIIKVQLSDFTRVGAVTLPTGENSLYGAALDATNGYLYFITRTTPGGVVKLATSSFTRLGAITFNTGENPTEPAILDTAAGYLYTASQTTPGKAIKVALSPKGFVFGTKVTLPETGYITHVSMHSHTASGNLRVAIYNSSKTLLWESQTRSNTASGDVLNFPIANGSPAVLKLDAGTYYLAFQTSSTSSVPSYAAGSSGDGFYYGQEYGSFPASISGETTSSETYTIYAGYETQTSGGSGSSSGGSGSVPSAPSTPTNPPEIPPVIPPVQQVAHDVGSLIADSNGTIYSIVKVGDATVRRPYTSAASFLSYGYNSFAAVVGATQADLALPIGAFVAPRDGSILCSDRLPDKGTCYIMSQGLKRGITSQEVFLALGYSFKNALVGDVSFVSEGSVLNSATLSHPVGTLVRNGSTLQIIGPSGLIGLPSLEVLYSWGYRLEDQVLANITDLQLSQTTILNPRDPSQIGITY